MFVILLLPAGGN